MDKLKDKHISWTVYTFLAFCILSTGLLIWQLYGLTPHNWCFVAKTETPKDPTACITVLQELLRIKDHIVIGLIGIFGLGYICHAVVVLKVAVKADIPGGGSIDIGGDKD